MRSLRNFAGVSVSWKTSLRNNKPNRIRPFGAAAVIAVLCTLGSHAGAEFYVFYDDEGHKHVSSIPAHGFASNGDIKRAYDPNSIVYQYARMREILAEQGVEITHKREDEQPVAEFSRQTQQTPVVRHAPRDGIMNLDELIALEKRGGKHGGASADRSLGSDRLK